MGPLVRRTAVMGQGLELTAPAHRRGAAVTITTRWTEPLVELEGEELLQLEAGRIRAAKRWAIELGVRVASIEHQAPPIPRGGGGRICKSVLYPDRMRPLTHTAAVPHSRTERP